jgi:transcriptional regulator of acetoin/glycerol metabolism
VRAAAGTAAAGRGPLPLNLGETELALIRRALDECRGNRTLAAAKLGISRRTLHRKLREHPALTAD